MSKGLTLPLVVVFIGIFLSVPVMYFAYVTKLSDSLNVKGVATEQKLKNGLNVTVTSANGTWDLYQFLCKTKEECLQSLTSGKSWGTVSGGVTKDQVVSLTAEDTYSFVKIYVKSGWGSMMRNFEIRYSPQIPEIEVSTITSGGSDYSVVLFPVSRVTSSESTLIELFDSVLPF